MSIFVRSRLVKMYDVSSRLEEKEWREHARNKTKKAINIEWTGMRMCP